MGRNLDRALDLCAEALSDARTTPRQARTLLAAIKSAGEDEGGGERRRSPEDEKKIRELEGRVAELEKKGDRGDEPKSLDAVKRMLEDAANDPDEPKAEREKARKLLEMLEEADGEKTAAMAHIGRRMASAEGLELGVRHRGNALELGFVGRR